MRRRAPVALPSVEERTAKRKRTGRYWGCQSNVIDGAHGDVGPVAVALKLDKGGGVYYRCPFCGDQHFFSREWWTEGHGLSEADARRMGLTLCG